MHRNVRNVLRSSDYLRLNNCGSPEDRRNISNMPTRKHTTAEGEELDRFSVRSSNTWPFFLLKVSFFQQYNELFRCYPTIVTSVTAVSFSLPTLGYTMPVHLLWLYFYFSGSLYLQNTLCQWQSSFPHCILTENIKPIEIHLTKRATPVNPTISNFVVLSHLTLHVCSGDITYDLLSLICFYS